MKKTTKILSITLVLSLLLSTTIFANNINEAENYIVTYSAEEITDVEQLLSLALLQKSTTPQSGYRNAITGADDCQLTATQILAVRKYENGYIEKDMLESSFTFTNDNGEKIDLSKATPRAIDSASGGRGTVAAQQQLSYTVGLTPGSGNLDITLNYTQGRVIQNQNNQTVRLELWYTYALDLGVGNTIVMPATSNAILNTWYTQSIYRTFTVHYYWGGAGGGGTYIINNSESFDISMTANTDGY